MKKYVRLLNDECRKGSQFILLLGGLLFGAHGAFTVLKLLQAKRELQGNPNFQFQLLELFDHAGIFTLLFGIAAGSIIIFNIYNWVREWRTQDKMIYRLLMYPGNRFSIAIAKLSMMALTVLSFIATLYLYIHLLHFICQRFFPLGAYGGHLYQFKNIQDAYLTGMFYNNDPHYLLLVYGVIALILVVTTNLVLIYFSLPYAGVWKRLAALGGYLASHAGVIGIGLSLSRSFVWLTNELLLGWGLLVLMLTLLNLLLTHYLMEHRLSV